jgi:putative flavoprotein involved in K+ transport
LGDIGLQTTPLNHTVQRAEQWVAQLHASVAEQDWNGIASLFQSDSHWRDLVAFTWNFGTASGPAAIAERFRSTFASTHPRNFRISDENTGPTVLTRNGRDSVDVHLQFETAQGSGVALARLVPDNSATSGLICWLLLTKLTGVNGRPALKRPRDPGRGFTPRTDRQNWLDVRREEQDFADREPEAVIIGAGHAGLFVAAHLRRLGVDTLVVEAHPRVGDGWRNRYRSLSLHNKTDMNQFPYLSYPETFPDYLPRDRFADWLEFYASATDVNVWTSTRFLGGTYDQTTGVWDVKVERSDGTQRTLRPRHIVSATGGFGGHPHVPHLNGIETFAGGIGHTQTFRSGEQYAGKNVVVVGTGTSAHDVALELYNDGAAVTLLQRGSTTVLSLHSANSIWTNYTDDSPIEEADLKGLIGFIHPIFVDTCQRDDGDNDTGWLMKFYARGGGYYFNVGCSDVIVEGGISILATQDVDGFVPTGVKLKSGEIQPLDFVVFATAYENRQEENRQFFGDAIAESVGPIGGFDERNEVRNAFSATAQPGLWFMFGGILAARQYSPLVALQIATALDGPTPAPEALPETGSNERGTDALMTAP